MHGPYTPGAHGQINAAITHISVLHPLWSATHFSDPLLSDATVGLHNRPGEKRLHHRKLPSNFTRSERRGHPAIDVFYVDELIAKDLSFALQIRQHPIAILLFIRLLARVHVGRTIPQHALDQPGQLMRGRRNRFGRAQPSPHPTVIGS